MKYIHPTLGRVAIRKTDGTYTVNLKDSYYESDLPHLGFEQVEEIPEWIKKAAEDLNKTGAWRVYKGDGLEQFAKAILDNIPKVTMEDIEDWLRSVDTLRGYDYHYTRGFITNALRNKGLLQE